MKKIFLYALAYIFSGSVVYAGGGNLDQEDYPSTPLPSTKQKDYRKFSLHKGLPSEAGNLILQFAGTKNVQGVCKNWDEFIWGAGKFRGVGHFFLQHDDVKFSITNELLKRFSNVKSLTLQFDLQQD